MDALKLIYLTIVNLGKQLWSLSHTIVRSIGGLRHRTVRNQLEAERLDRIRNPDKYLGK